MRNRCSPRLARLAIGCLGISLLGCESIHSPSSEPAPIDQIEKAHALSPAQLPADTPSQSVVVGHRARNATPAAPLRPFKGQIKTFDKVWSVSHFQEQMMCGDLIAGAAIDISGNFTHLGNTQGSASAAWNWGSPALGTYSPEGPVTGTSATIMPEHTFCSASQTATGDVVLARKNGDELHGSVVGGEVYELGFMTSGDGQEQFIEIEINGGTGRFTNARGKFVLHAVVHLLGQSLIKGEILDGQISY